MKGSTCILVSFAFTVFVKKGDLEIHISKINHESRILVEEGDITIKMIDTHPLKLTVSTFLLRNEKLD